MAKMTSTGSSQYINWETTLLKYFQTKTRGFLVSNVCPSKDRGGRNIWEEDKDVLMPLAEKYGYKLVSEKAHVQFVNPDFPNPFNKKL